MRLLRLFAVVLFTFPCLAYADQLVTNGGFETGSFGGWTVQTAPAGSDLFVGQSYMPSTTNAYAAHFDGLAFGSYDVLQQTLLTSAGATYDISFDLSEQGCDPTACDFQALWDGTLFYDSHGAQGGSNQTFSYNLLGQGSDLLTFRAYNEPDRTLLDNVSAVAVTTPPSTVTPEPGSLTLLATGFAAGALELRRRRA